MCANSRWLLEVQQYQIGSGPGLILQCIPVLYSSSGMRNADRSSHEICNTKYFKKFFRTDSQIMAFAYMVLNTIITAKDHRSNKSQEFLCFYRQGPILISSSIQTP